MVCGIQFALKPKIKDTLRNLPKNFPFVFMKPHCLFPIFIQLETIMSPL